MVKLTMIARVTDGLPLVEGLDDGRDMPDADFYKQQVKALFKNLSRGQNQPSRMSIETGPYIFQYSFYKYTFMQRTKKLYQDTRTQRNIAKLNDELYEVHQIMTRNVQEVLGVGEKLDQVSQMSSRLTSESRMYAKKAKDLNRQARRTDETRTPRPLQRLAPKNLVVCFSSSKSRGPLVDLDPLWSQLSSVGEVSDGLSVKGVVSTMEKNTVLNVAKRMVLG
ncbi:25.3 kDa vesicle transport protein [Striga hermonthica]|uniref:25.3 kDa vesicle transport protein n=1 Tax=Striga hermonthica TaxID=68872 RepID=A0A9N7MP12_STRHE|nr:25.3 kDa vesicle transport protein [Striga hermonthica]